MRLFIPPLSSSATVRTPSGRRARHPAIAGALRTAIAGGQLSAGESLPSSRELARHFGVHRHTVLTALDALLSEGWIESSPRRGYSVCPDLPAPDLLAPAPASSRSPRPLPVATPLQWRFVSDGPPATGVDLPSVVYPLHSATADPLLLPREELRSAYAGVLRRRRTAIFEHGDERGYPALVKVLGQYLRRVRGIRDREMLVTHGSQEAIVLVARALLGPGDRVAVEDPGYPPAIQAFRAAGARLVPIAVDEQGLDVDALRKAMQRGPIRLVYVTPAHHYPTTVTLSASRRLALLDLTRRMGTPILEDDYDHEHHYRGWPPHPLAAASTHVIYVSTLSKLIAPGVRIGFVASGADVIERLVRLRRIATPGIDGVTHAAMADWIQDGGFERHVRRARRAYRLRGEAVMEALERARQEGCEVDWRAPDGGLTVWTRWPGLDTTTLAARAGARGVSVLAEARLRISSPRRFDGLRIAFSRQPPERLRAAIAIVAEEARALERER